MKELEYCITKQEQTYLHSIRALGFQMPLYALLLCIYLIEDIRWLDSLSITGWNKFDFNYSRGGKQLGSLRVGAGTKRLNQKSEWYIACC